MFFSKNTSAAIKASLVHLILSLCALSISAAVIFFIWYPGDYAKLSGVIKIFYYLVIVDLFCGPLLTLLIFNPSKKKNVWIKDLFVIFLLQITSFIYGLLIVFEARPILLVFEGDRFRLVSNLNLNKKLSNPNFFINDRIFSGPQIIAARLSKPGDADYLESVKLSMQGIYPSFRPDRWIPYNKVTGDVLNSSKEISFLGEDNILKSFFKTNNITEINYKYLPITIDSLHAENWIAIIDQKNGNPIKFLPVNGWKD